MSLKNFFHNPRNSVTRERLFLNKLYFDIKLAAARADYPLSLFEPEVDRDKFDIVLDDADNQRQIQLKTYTISSRTSAWKSNKRFMRPNLEAGNALDIVPMDCGLGGGFLLIEIDDQEKDAPVSYLYTDRSLITGLASGLIGEYLPAKRRRGPQSTSRKKLALDFLAELARGNPRDPITLHKRLFVRLKSPDSILAIAGLHSDTDCYLPAGHFLAAEVQDVQVNQNGLLASPADPVVTSLQVWMDDVLKLLDEPNLQRFAQR